MDEFVAETGKRLTSCQWDLNQPGKIGISSNHEWME